MEILNKLRQKPELLSSVVAAGLLMLFVCARFIPHPANFSPIGAVAFLSGLWMIRRSWLLLLPFVMIFLTDLALGLYDGIAFVYLAYALMAALGVLYAKLKFESKSLKLGYFAMFNVSASVVFFFVSNLGVWWATALYSRDLHGLLECFVLAIPFYPMTLLSQVMYAVAIQAALSWGVVPALAALKTRP